MSLPLQPPDPLYTSPRNAATSGRILSVDALRGFDMFWIVGGEGIFKGIDRALNTPLTNRMAAQLDHAIWYGFNFYDIIMPLFMFLVGVSMVYSVQKRLSADPSRRKLWKHVLIRVLILWILGMMVQGNLLTYDPGQIKFYSNTLQAIAAGYLVASVFILYLPLLYQVGATIGLMLAYWAVFAWVPGSGGTYSPDGNIAIFIDKLLLGSFQDGTPYTWILSSLNFGATTMLGVFTAYMLRAEWRPVQKSAGLALGGAVLILLSLIWMPWHPLVKHLWTGSFVLYSGGICMLMLAVLYFLIDVRGYRTWATFLVVIGANAIFAYVSSHVFDYGLIARIFVGGLEKYTGGWYLFIICLSAFSVLYLLLRYMHRNRIFVKI
jgi:predicted acyltransferase